MHETDIYDWFDRASVDYYQLYIALFVAYSGWFRRVTGAASDREAIHRLKGRFVIWQDYQTGRTLQQLRKPVDQLIQAARELAWVTPPDHPYEIGHSSSSAGIRYDADYSTA